LKKQHVIVAVVVVIVIVGALVFNRSQTTNADRFPQRPVANAVFASAGGGTDQWNRLISNLMEKPLGTTINVSNMTGGRGGVAAAWGWDAPHDGYRWLGASETLVTMAVNGAHSTTMKDWEFFVIASSPGVLCVAADSPYQTYEELVQAAMENPDMVTIAHSGTGRLWHIKAYIAADVGNVPFSYVPYDGSRPAIVATISNETAAVSASAGEVFEFVRSGQLRPLVMLENESFEFPGYGTVPGAADTFASVREFFPIDQWLGFMLPADTPEAVLKKIDAAFKEAMQNPDVKKLADDTVSKLYGISGQEAKDLMLSMESSISWLLHEWEMTEAAPDTLGIPKP